MKINKLGFSLIEVLVTVTILTIIGVAIATIVTRSFDGNQKTELIGNIKQNGQSALAIMEKDMRESDTVVCPDNTSGLILTLLTKTNGQYIRFTMVPESGVTNGTIYRELLTFQYLSATPDKLCDLQVFPIGTQSTQISLIDSNSKSAISLKSISGNGFTVIKSPGFKDTIKVQFDLGAATNSQGTFADSIGGTTSSIPFRTTVQIR